MLGVMASAFHSKRHVVGLRLGINLSEKKKNWGEGYPPIVSSKSTKGPFGLREKGGGVKGSRAE